MQSFSGAAALWSACASNGRPMNPILANILARDAAADQQRLSDRLAYFENRIPQSRARPIDKEVKIAKLPSDGEIPEISATALTPDLLRSAMATSGCLLVRQLVASDVITEIADVIDRVIDSAETSTESNSQAEALYGVFANPPGNLEQLLPQPKLGWSRGFHRNGGSAMSIESASVAESLLELYESMGLKTFLTDYLGERPCLSALKWVLRRPKLPTQPDGWHQDGAFMGEEINSLNMWLAVSECGGDSGAPSMDMVPRRLTEIFAAGDGSAVFDWSISSDAIRTEFGEGSIRTPAFAPGDALLFDHFLIHRTQYAESLHKPRYAIETWFFGEHNFPANQVPLRW